jgi:hypothetical protein
MRFLTVLLFSLLSVSLVRCQDKPPHYDYTQFPLGFPGKATNNALQQLQSYPLPRYYPGNKLQRLFNWMAPNYLGGGGDPTIKQQDAINNSVEIQRELALRWNYGINLLVAGFAFQWVSKGDSIPAFVRLANQYPGITADAITMWWVNPPKALGLRYKDALIYDRKADTAAMIKATVYGSKAIEPDFTFPDSLIQMDGQSEKFYLSRLCKYLTRPLNRLNENGEEPPGPYMESAFKQDPAMIRMKDSMKIDSWDDFMAIGKLHFRSVYSSVFLNGVPQLKNTQFSFYIVEGGPIDRFNWHIMKKIQTPINGMYYSTPDFYVRWPKNWKEWTGAWHGWKWIEDGRKVEIADGDNLFSPFVGAGWANNPEMDVRPGQWLGLLKCLSVIGAEFYYTGYFNLKAPFSNPADYVWQAAMPAYAQAITSRFEDVLRNGNVLFDANKQPIITYPVNDNDRHVLVTVRKHNTKPEYIICGTYQPFSNDSAEIPASKVVSINLAGKTLKFEARRQGSVYVYETTFPGHTIFYQLDKWHENAHPERWSKDFQFEAEVADSAIDPNSIYTTARVNGDTEDYSNAVTYVHIAPKTTYVYNFTVRDSASNTLQLYLLYKGKGEIKITLSGQGTIKEKKIELSSASDWEFTHSQLPADYKPGDYRLTISLVSGDVDLDKFIIKGVAH